MKLKLIPKNEQELSRLFVLIFPLTLLLSLSTSFLRNAYFTFANLIPNNKIFNYGFLDTLYNQATYGLLFATCTLFIFHLFIFKISWKNCSAFSSFISDIIRSCWYGIFRPSFQLFFIKIELI